MKSAIVVGVSDGDMGQVLHGVVYVGTSKVSTEGLIAFLSERLQNKKIPRSFSWAQTHLRGEDGKCRRAQVAADVSEMLRDERGKAHKPKSRL